MDDDETKLRLESKLRKAKESKRKMKRKLKIKFAQKYSKMKVKLQERLRNQKSRVQKMKDTISKKSLDSTVESTLGLIPEIDSHCTNQESINSNIDHNDEISQRSRHR